MPEAESGRSWAILYGGIDDFCAASSGEPCACQPHKETIKRTTSWQRPLGGNRTYELCILTQLLLRTTHVDKIKAIHSAEHHQGRSQLFVAPFDEENEAKLAERTKTHGTSSSCGSCDTGSSASSAQRGHHRTMRAFKALVLATVAVIRVDANCDTTFSAGCGSNTDPRTPATDHSCTAAECVETECCGE